MSSIDTTSAAPQPVQPSQRHIILDAVRGFALLGVCLANYPEFSLFTFLSDEQQAQLAGAWADQSTRFAQLWLIDGKFYTLFSMLFGIGFSIIIGNALRRGGNGMRVFYRRMSLLALIGLAHLLLLWSGDILLLYALMGMLLPLWRNASDRAVLGCGVAFLLLPVVADGCFWLMASNPADGLEALWWQTAAAVGITEVNFATWLRDATSYHDVHLFLQQGAVERMWEFVDGHRYFKVLGLFLLGFYAGRSRLYARLHELRPVLVRFLHWALVPALLLSAVYAYSGQYHPWPRPVHSLLYMLSVYPLALCYAALLCLAYLRSSEARVWRLLAAPGRMALTCYLSQSLVGLCIFYGVGFGLGASMGLAATEAVALLVYGLEVAFAMIWFKAFAFGPMEWLWRMLTYGRWLNLRKGS